MRLLSWNTKFGRGTSAAIALADRIAADAVMLQEAQPAGLWSGPLVGAAVPNRAWGRWVLVRSGALEPMAVANYSGWVIGARWRRDPADLAGDIYLFSVHSPTPNDHEVRGSYVDESCRIVVAISALVPASRLATTSISSRSGNGCHPKQFTTTNQSCGLCASSETRGSRSLGKPVIPANRYRRRFAGIGHQQHHTIATASSPEGCLKPIWSATSCHRNPKSTIAITIRCSCTCARAALTNPKGADAGPIVCATSHRGSRLIWNATSASVVSSFGLFGF